MPDAHDNFGLNTVATTITQVDNFDAWFNGAVVIAGGVSGDFGEWLNGAPVLGSRGSQNQLAGVGRRRAWVTT